jgi:nicotinamide-nucleotide amidase
VLITGGLGPTQDDLTREALARVAGVELVFDQPSFDLIAAMFSRRGRIMPERNRVQALFPSGAEPIRNDRGTAPGVWMRIGEAVVAAMPGVPTEMYHMFETQVLPLLQQLGLSSGVLVQRKINTFGTGESHVEQKLFDLTRRDHVPEVGITASDAIISLRIFGRGTSPEAALAQIEPIERIIRERLGDLVFGTGDEDVQHALLGLLAAKRKTLSAAEGVTGGVVGEQITSVPGASAWFRGGIIAYDNRLKVDLLGVPQELLDDRGAVSAEVAEAMAAGCRTRLGTDLAVSTVGVAGPADGGADRPVGLVHVGLAWEGGASSASFSWIGTRAEVQRRTARLALNRARLHLLRG